MVIFRQVIQPSLTLALVFSTALSSGVIATPLPTDSDPFDTGKPLVLKKSKLEATEEKNTNAPNNEHSPSPSGILEKSTEKTRNPLHTSYDELFNLESPASERAYFIDEDVYYINPDKNTPPLPRRNKNRELR